MRCPVCDALKLEGPSFLTKLGHGWRTTDAKEEHIDERGRFHCHDPNATHMEWVCLRGHHVWASWYEKCPAPGCDYQQHEMEKVPFGPSREKPTVVVSDRKRPGQLSFEDYVVRARNRMAVARVEKKVREDDDGAS
jgi:hypothetical protein